MQMSLCYENDPSNSKNSCKNPLDPSRIAGRQCIGLVLTSLWTKEWSPPIPKDLNFFTLRQFQSIVCFDCFSSSMPFQENDSAIANLAFPSPFSLWQIYRQAIFWPFLLCSVFKTCQWLCTRDLSYCLKRRWLWHYAKKFFSYLGLPSLYRYRCGLNLGRVFKPNLLYNRGART